MIKNKKKGFTLTEVLVVVLIIGVLAAVVYPMYTKAITKSRAVEAINLLEMVRNKQMQQYARNGGYYENFEDMGQLTSDKSFESSAAVKLKVRDYTLTLNTATNCMSAKYEKGSSSFTFSTSYETAGLGCSGAVCSSFGDIIGAAETVCNCGSKTCGGNFTQDPDTCNCNCLVKCEGNYILNNSTCNCECNLTCSGGQVSNGACGCSCPSPKTEWNGSSCGCPSGTCEKGGQCISPSSTCTEGASESEACGKGGTRTKTCQKGCPNSWGAWGGCEGEGCTPGEKETQACGNCGTQVRTCGTDYKWGSYSACVNGGDGCLPTSSTKEGCTFGSAKVCSSSCVWGGCEGGGDCEAGTSATCGNCGTKTCGDDFKWGECTAEGECEDGSVEVGGICPEGKSGNLLRTCGKTCNWGEWGGCTDKTPCPETCESDSERDLKVKYSEDGECCKKTCEDSYGSEKNELTWWGPTDECDGNKSDRYTCEGEAKTCLDSFRDELDSPFQEDQFYGNVDVSFVSDQCDGNKNEKFTCDYYDYKNSKYCQDVYDCGQNATYSQQTKSLGCSNGGTVSLYGAGACCLQSQMFDGIINNDNCRNYGADYNSFYSYSDIKRNPVEYCKKANIESCWMPSRTSCNGTSIWGYTESVSGEILNCNKVKECPTRYVRCNGYMYKSRTVTCCGK